MKTSSASGLLPVAGAEGGRTGADTYRFPPAVATSASARFGLRILPVLDIQVLGDENRIDKDRRILFDGISSAAGEASFASLGV
jgi:hypothetical protein